MSEEFLNVGDTVIWKSNFGKGPETSAKINRMEWCQVGSKEGQSISYIHWSRVYTRQLVVTLDNGHWAYGTQLVKK